jgi:hypothetical protein
LPAQEDHKKIPQVGLKQGTFIFSWSGSWELKNKVPAGLFLVKPVFLARRGGGGRGREGEGRRGGEGRGKERRGEERKEERGKRDLILFPLFFPLMGQGFLIADQVLYHLSHTSSPFCSGYFGGRGLSNCFPRLVSRCDPPNLSFPSS